MDHQSLISLDVPFPADISNDLIVMCVWISALQHVTCGS